MSQSVPPGFEGSEKKLHIDFDGNADLRRIPRSEWDEILTLASCTIISCTRTDFIDSYVLSESSLFVFSDKVIIKTCGTTGLLKCLPRLLDAARSLGTKPEFVQYSRTNFLFPSYQPFPHRSFASEVKYLNQFFHGNAYMLGPLNGPRWHLYVADLKRAANHSTDQSLEIVMFDLDRTVMEQFYQKPSLMLGGQSVEYTGKLCTKVSGIDQLIPGMEIDEFLFSPCGYSCNALKDDSYFTIHITPEAGYSYLSFETNAPMADYSALVRTVLDTFKPRTWTIHTFVDKFSTASDAEACVGWSYPGFSRVDKAMHHFENDYNFACANFLFDEPVEIESPRSTSSLALSLGSAAEEDACALEEDALSEDDFYAKLHGPASRPKGLPISLNASFDSARSDRNDEDSRISLSDEPIAILTSEVLSN